MSGLTSAGAGLALFLGAGFDAGVVAAKVGVQGALSLGDISLPLEAGAGIAVGSEVDQRPPAGDEDGRFMVLNEPLVPMKKYSINAIYKYGASLVIKDILHGQIDAAVKVKFLGFSKRWSATLLHFDGLCSEGDGCKYPLFGGGGDVGSVDFQLVDFGSVLMPTRFLRLQRPTLPVSSASAGGGGAALDVGRAGELFYDNLCTCIPRSEDAPGDTELRTCQRNLDCCGYAEQDFCFQDPADDNRGRCTDCREEAESCQTDGQCCDDQLCINLPGDGLDHGTCTGCREKGKSCETAAQCCGDQRCIDRPGDGRDFGVCSDISTCGGPCQVDEDCAGDLICHNTEGTRDSWTCDFEERGCGII